MKKIVEGLFKYGQEVVVEIDGNLYKRKVHYADGELFISIDGCRYKDTDFVGGKKFDKSAYDMEYLKNNRDRISVLASKGSKDKWKQYASDLGMSMNAFIIYCVEKEIHG